MMIETIQVFDLDGVLADSSHRYQLGADGKIDLEHWRYHSDKVFCDSVLPTAEVYKEGLQADNIATIIATARVWCQQSTAWVIENLGPPDQLIYRLGDDDTRGGALLKIAGIKPLLDLPKYSNVQKIEVFEDNADYLKAICDALPNSIGHYIPSEQGH